MAAAPDGSVYVAVTPPGKLQQGIIHMRDSKGRWTTVAPVDHELGRVRALATDASGRLYVDDVDVERAAWRVEIRDLDGKWYELPHGGSPGHSELSHGSHLGVAVDRRGTVYFALDGPPRVLRWTPQPEAKVNVRPF